MPVAKRIVEPIRLSRAPIGEGDSRFDLDQVSNNALVCVLQQLGSLAAHAEDLFDELSKEVQKVIARGDRLTNKVTGIAEHVSTLNARQVKVPVGDLASFSEQTDHYHAEHGYTTSLFTPASRPHCINVAYEKACITPIPALRHCNLYRADGKTGSKLFTLSPIVLEDQYVDDPEMEMPPRKPIMAAYFERRPKEIAECRKRPRSLPTLNDLDTFVDPHKSVLPTPEARLADKSRSHPANVVPIHKDTFQRQSCYRTSQRSVTGGDVVDTAPAPLGSMRRRKKLMSQSGTNIVFRDQSNDNRAVDQRSASRERWERAQSMNIEHYAAKPTSRRSRSRERKNRNGKEREDDSPVERSCSLRRSFRSLFKSHSKSRDLWAEGRPHSPGPPVINIDLPFRRSRSLPRCLRVFNAMNAPVAQTWSTRSASTEGRLDTAGDEVDGRSISSRSSVSRDFASRSSVSHDVPSRSTAPRDLTPHRSTGALAEHRSSEKIKRFPSIRRCQSSSVSLRVAGSINRNLASASPEPASGNQRPKSMDVSTLMSLIQPIPVATPTTPADALRKQSTPSNPTGQMEVPWAGSLTNVRLRPSADKERESSSGNWSGSFSSARCSLDSDYHRLHHKTSASSLDKDSALSLNSQSIDGRSTTDICSTTTGETSTVNGDQSTVNGDTSTIGASSSSGSMASSDKCKTITRKNSEHWLRQKQQMKLLSCKDMPSSGSTDSSMSTIGLTTKNLRAHDSSQRPFNRQGWRSPDEDSSVYSVDQEGFYTSMHNDSGLRRSGIDLIAEEDPISLTPIEPACVQQQKTKRKHRRRSASLLDNLSNGKRRSKKKSVSPPVTTNPVTAHKDHHRTMDCKDFPTPPSPGELKKMTSSDEGSLVMSSFALPPQSKLHSPPPPTEEMTFSESDAETIYARVKIKSSISSSAYPSLCFVGSDEEDGDMLSYSKSWRERGSSVPEGLPRQPTPEKSTPTTTRDDSFATSIEENDLEQSASSTWPRSPRIPRDGSILKSTTSAKGSHPPRTLNFAPSVTLFDSATGQHSEGALAADTSIFGTKRSLKPANSFKGSSDESISSGSSTHTTQFSSSSSENGVVSHYNIDNQTLPKVSNTLQHPVKGKPGPSKKVSIPTVDISKMNADSHIYPNVVVLKNQGAVPKQVPITGVTTHVKSTKTGSKSDAEVHTITPELQPQPAGAKLIISSHVATKVSFKENPYKRSICSPVSNDDLVSFWNFTGRDRSKERTPIEDKLVPKPSETGAMKHSVSFPTSRSDKTNYGRSWYDGIQTTNSMVVIPASTTSQSNGLMSTSATKSHGFNSFLQDQRRDSIASTVSTDSGWRSRSSKASPALSRSSLKSDEIADDKTKPPRPQPVVPERTMLPSTSTDPDQDEPDVMAHKDISGSKSPQRQIIKNVHVPKHDDLPKEKVIIKAQVTPTNSLGKNSSAKCPVKVTYPPTPQRFPLEDSKNKQKKHPRPVLPPRTSPQIIPITTGAAVTAEPKPTISTMSSFRPAEKKQAVQLPTKPSAYPVVKVSLEPVVKPHSQSSTSATPATSSGVSTTPILSSTKSPGNTDSISPQSVKPSIVSDLKNGRKSFHEEDVLLPSSKSVNDPVPPVISNIAPVTSPVVKPPLNVNNDSSIVKSNNASIRPSAFSSNTFGTPVIKFNPKPLSLKPKPLLSADKHIAHPALPSKSYTQDKICDTKSSESVITKPPLPSHNDSSSIATTQESSNVPTNLTRKSIGKSTDSLASYMTGKSYDSIGSSGSALSLRAERTRCSKLSFFDSAPAPQESSIDDRFSKFKKPQPVTQTKTEKMNSKNKSESNLSVAKTSVPGSPDRGAPIQGRFVNSMINQYLSKSRESLTSPCSSTSSGLGSSVANSPTSPSRTNSCFTSPPHPHTQCSKVAVS